MQFEDPLYRRVAVTCACNNLKSAFVIRNKDVALYVQLYIYLIFSNFIQDKKTMIIALFTNYTSGYPI